jgi:hypothetical protein
MVWNSNAMEAGVAAANPDSANENLEYLKNAIDNISTAFDNALLHIREEQTAGTDGGTFTSGAWQKRALNTVKINEITGASLNSNVVTLAAGTYFCEGYGTAYAVVTHKTRLYQTSGTPADLLTGSSERTIAAAGVSNRSTFSGRFTLSAESTVELQHRCGTTANNTGFGYAVNLDSKVEVYSELKIWKLS